MSKDDSIEYDGKVIQVCRDAKFLVELTDKSCIAGCKVLANISGKMRQHYIRILEGDKVRLEMPPLKNDEELKRMLNSRNKDVENKDLFLARIVYRYK